MKKNTLAIEGRVHVYDEGKKKSKFTMHYLIFNPKKGFVVNKPEALEAANKVMHISNAKLMDRYDVLYCKASNDRMGRKKVWVFSPCPKPESNCVFVIPKKWRKEARKAIFEFFLPA